ncbi:MAG: LysM peptidoglycan-binding domain-containing protein [Bacteroidota bacterium]
MKAPDAAVFFRTLTIRGLFALLACLLACSPSFAQPPQEIPISKSTATIDGKKYYLHTIDKGQTVYAIAKTYGVSVNDIVADNPGSLDVIKPGQVLKISYDKVKKNKKDTGVDPPPPDGDYYYHKVSQGETFYSISKKYNVQVEALMKWNEQSVGGLKEGSILKIPGNPQQVKSPGPTKVTVLKKDTLASKAKGNYTGEKKFKVALFLPFQLYGLDLIETEKIKKGYSDFPEKSKIAVEFYQGALMALDSLKKTGVSVKLFVYDSGADSASNADLAKKPELKEMDLFIGPLYSANFVAIAKVSKDNNIPIVSPLAQNNKLLLGNANVSKTNPSAMTHVEQMACYIGQHYAKENIIVVSGKAKDMVYVNAFKKTMNAELQVRQLPASDSVKTVNGIFGVKGLLNSARINIVVIPTSDPSVATDYMSKLNKMKDDLKDSIIVFGMQSWEDIGSIDFAYMNNLNLHIPSSGFVDYRSAAVRQFISDYRARYNTEPSEYVYTGYDVMFYYVSALAKYGPDNLQPALPEFKASGLRSGFDFYQTAAESGYENKRVFILRYSDSAQMKMN